MIGIVLSGFGSMFTLIFIGLSFGTTAELILFVPSVAFWIAIGVTIGRYIDT